MRVSWTGHNTFLAFTFIPCPMFPNMQLSEQALQVVLVVPPPCVQCRMEPRMEP